MTFMQIWSDTLCHTIGLITPRARVCFIADGINTMQGETVRSVRLLNSGTPFQPTPLTQDGCAEENLAGHVELVF